MKIEKLEKTNFKSGLNALSKGLYALQNNDMLNASFVDIFAMDTPRTIVEFNHRGKNAGIEMGFREYTGTFIAEFSAALFAFLSSKVFSKFYKPEIKVNSSSWATNNTLDVIKSIYEVSDKTQDGFIDNVLKSMSGLVGNKITKFDSKNTKNIKDKLKTLINQDLDKKSSKKLLNNVQDEIIANLKADNNIFLKSGKDTVSANLSHILRDVVDISKHVLFKEGVNIDSAIDKLKTMNKTRVAIAIPLSMFLAITNQYINRKLTKKRTGIDNFVGENDYEKNVKDKNQAKNQKGLIFKKMLSAGGFLLMLSKVMNLKKPSDLINKLEFTGPATGGNAIKTIYGTLILGRIFASKDSTELRETTVRDYLGFLNWLVLGGFVSKGVAQIFDPKKKELFNISKEGKGIKHWLSNVSIKSQKEILSSKNVSSNLKKLNIAQISGILYSAIMLGVLLPKLNIWLTKRGKNKENLTIMSFKGLSFNEFKKNTDPLTNKEK